MNLVSSFSVSQNSQSSSQVNKSANIFRKIKFSWSQQRMKVNGNNKTVLEDQCETNKNLKANRGETKALDLVHFYMNQIS